MIKADFHTHTNYSHAAHSVLEMYMAAKERGIAIYGFSEHSPRPAGYNYTPDYQEKLQARYAQYINEVQALCRGNSEAFKVLLGLEVDYIPAELNFGRQAVQAAAFDYVIGGLHFQGNWGFDGDAADWEKLSVNERFACYARYYEDMISMCKSGLVDIIAHPDLIKIYSIDTFNAWLALPESSALVRKALTEMRERDLIMEVSSAGLRKPCGEIYPGPAIMRMAADLGLKICVSSDAHATAQIAYAFDQLEEYARSFGFSQYHYVEKRQKHALAF